MTDQTAQVMALVDAEYQAWDMVHIEMCDREDDVPADLMKLIHECRNEWPQRRAAVEREIKRLVEDGERLAARVQELEGARDRFAGHHTECRFERNLYFTCHPQCPSLAAHEAAQ